jgi:hypothetical protein
MRSAEMEHAFSLTTRFQDILGRDEDDEDSKWTELELLIPVEDFLACSWDWKYLQAILAARRGVSPRLLWITEHVFLIVEESCHTHRFDDENHIAADIRAASGEDQALILVQLQGGSDKLTAELGVFWRALATSNSVGLTIHDELTRGYEFLRSDELHDSKGGLPSGPLLTQFLRESPSLKFLQFNRVRCMEEHCRALASLQRTDLEITLHYCKFDPEEAEGAFIEWFRHNQVVKEIKCIEMQSRILSALSGNNSIKRLKLKLPVGKEELCSLLQALPGNMGIEDLTLHDVKLTDKNWCLLLQSLSTHPLIKCVSFNCMTFLLSNESRITWRKAVLQMLRHNTVVHTLDLPHEIENEDVYQDSILSRLEMNRNYFEVQRKAVKRADPSIRSQLLGRVLHVVRYNPNLIFQFLSENVPAFVRTEEEEKDSAISLQIESATIVSGQKRKAS